ncbi:unnamed protein product [Larinioides sclopetarius]|uniref:Uncharacterized protein n=1 Tax=Larinioides sclopetarius TaxID=280406 RepID=A0AAV2AGB8_9ARAC
MILKSISIQWNPTREWRNSNSKLLSAFEQSSNKKIEIAGRSKHLWNFQAGYFAVGVQNLNDTPIMSSGKLVSFPDGCLNLTLQLVPTSLGFTTF